MIVGSPWSSLPLTLDGVLKKKEDEEKVTSRLNWVAFKQQFFTSIIIAEKGFNKPTFLTSKKNENSKYIKDLYAKFELPYTHKNKEQINLQFYFGPNHGIHLWFYLRFYKFA